MDADVEKLAQQIVQKFASTPPHHRLLVAIAGRPGSGKSTLAYPLTDRINELLLHHPPPHPALVNQSQVVAAPNPKAGLGDDLAVCVGQDGWHYSRAELDSFPDPVEAHWRRGAAFTFNLHSYRDFVTQLRDPVGSNSKAIPFPTFDHAVKDPCPSPTPVLPQHRIVVLEGLYTLLSLPGWKECAEMMDLRVWVEVPREIVRQRVIRRNFEAGIVDDIKKCEERVDASDMINGDQVFANRFNPTDIIYPVSRDES